MILRLLIYEISDWNHGSLDLMETKKQITLDQRSFLVPLIGGRYHIITQLAIYKWYISGIYSQLGDYVVPTTY